MPAPVNSICYMFWDVFPVYPASRIDRDLEPEARRQHAAVEDACLEVMEWTLELHHPSCQEGALHGLGHFRAGYRQRVKAVVDAFLQRQKANLPDEIRTYALAARSGTMQ